jgi:ankyrin repeat protein
LIESNEDYLRIKNNDNKTPLYLAIHNSKTDIINLLLSKLDMSRIVNSHIYLHKAVRMRDPILTEKLIDLGCDINSTDDQGINNY